MAEEVVVIVEPLDVSEASHQRIRAAGYRLRLGRWYWDHPEQVTSPKALRELCQDAVGILTASREVFDRALLAQLPQLVVLSKYGIGVEKIDVLAATEYGIVVTHTPVYANVYAVAELTVGLMVALLRRLLPMQRWAQGGHWRAPHTVGRELRGQVVGLVGLGRIGSQVARLLQPWEVHLLGFDPYVSADAFAALGVTRCESLETLLAQADVVSLHVTVTEETRHLLNVQRLAQMKPGAFLVNTARGQLVDLEAVYAALASGQLGGAALDVTEPEPPPAGHPLFSMENVIITPHIAGFTEGALKSIIDAATDNLLQALRGEWPQYVRNPEVRPRWRGWTRGQPPA